MWYPLGVTDLPMSPVEGANNVPIAIKDGDAPPAAKLTNWIQTEKDLSVEETLALGFAPFSLDESGNHRTIVLDAMRYCEKGNVRWGVGVRFTLHAWSETGTIKGSIALVAAQASLNLAYTRASLQVLGYQKPDLAKLLPSFDEMNVSKYGGLMQSLDACRDIVLSADVADLTPCPIAVAIELPSAKDKTHWPFHIHHQ